MLLIITLVIYVFFTHCAVINLDNAHRSVVVSGSSDASSAGNFGITKSPEEDRRRLANCPLNCTFGYEHVLVFTVRRSALHGLGDRNSVRLW